MHPNAQLITDFYAAFARRDAEGMVACYAPDVIFSDPVFAHLRGDEARSMWRMLCERGKDLRVEASGIEADDREGKAHWEAWYTFSATGQKVHNIIDARFVFEGGKIARHTDTFDLRRWAGMALGLKGKLLGWLPPVQNAIRKQGDAGLRAWMKKHGA
ncbi:Ketosteroid isomerase-related protein [Minicystis rosea]|nr:Ketosteroid isomerase-related protein [Minicystis rosea]